jgi:hypothetical protein
MEHSEAQLGARLTLFVLAEHAHNDGSESYPCVDTIVRETRMTRRSVQAALRKLEADGMIFAEGKGDKGQTKWRVVMGGADTAPPPGGVVDDVEGRSSRHEGGVAATPKPSVKPSGEPTASSSGTAREPEWTDVPDDMREDARALLVGKAKVGSRIVTEAEIAIAAAALAEFNRQAESDYGLGANMRSIVMRIRERPSADAGAHIRLVQSAWRIRWWERTPDGRKPGPNVIYGEKSFDRVWQDASDEARGTLEQRQQTLRDAVWPDGRRYGDLTPGEQARAREAMAMGVQPWLPREEPTAPAANDDDEEPLTAETF